LESKVPLDTGIYCAISEDLRRAQARTRSVYLRILYQFCKHTGYDPDERVKLSPKKRKNASWITEGVQKDKIIYRAVCARTFEELVEKGFWISPEIINIFHKRLGGIE